MSAAFARANGFELPPLRQLGTDVLFGVAGKVCLVTGGGSGIGAMISAGLCANGCRVYLCSRKDAAGLAESLTQQGPGSCTWLQADITNAEHRDRVISTIDREVGVLHVLVNNSGTNWAEPFATYSPDAFEKVMRLNVHAVFALTQASYELLQRGAQRDSPSRVVNIGSIEGVSTPPHSTFAYATSKAAVLHLSRLLANELAADQITVNTILPGPFPSRMMRVTIERAGEDTVARSTALGRLGRPADMAAAVLFLVSPAASFITGAQLVVDGGCIVRPTISRL